MLLRLTPGRPLLTWHPLSHATARPRQADTSFECQATTGRQAARESARRDLTGNVKTSAGHGGSGPCLLWRSGLAGDGMGYAALAMVTGWPRSASICRMWFLILRSLSVRAW